MPSSPHYKRNYTQEMSTATKRGEDKGRAKRNKARRHAEKAGKVAKGDGKDVDHIKKLSSGGSAKDGNTRVRSRHANRADNKHRKGE